MKNEDLDTLHVKLLEMISDLDSFCKENEIDYVLSGGNVIGAVRHHGFIPWDDDMDIQMPRASYDKFLTLFHNNEKYYLQKEMIDYPMHFSKLRANNTTFIEDIPYRKKYKNMHQGIFIDIFPVDKVSAKKSQAKKQCIYANILIAQSLFLRGYPKNHQTFFKKVVMFLSVLLLPLRNYLNNYVKLFNKSDNFSYYCSFYGTTKKIFQDKSNFERPFPLLRYENLNLPVMNNYENYLKDAYGDYMKLPSESEQEYSVHAKFFSVNEDFLAYLENK